MEIVQFAHDHKYAIRKGTKNAYEFCSLKGDIFWWQPGSAYYEYYASSNLSLVEKRFRYVKGVEELDYYGNTYHQNIVSGDNSINIQSGSKESHKWKDYFKDIKSAVTKLITE